SRQPKWVNGTGNLQWQPTQATPAANLLLAGAHTRTAADVWSIEAAVESGRRAAQLIEPETTVLPQYQPAWLRLFGAVDDVFYRVGAPHVLELLRAGVLVGLVVLVLVVVSRL
ncbi:MAG: FAD-dependent oxidoreductase, partial [Frankiaceae bacterium]|nr:FAD-dependent oxidoreductase [Arenimonas sp.]